MAERHATFFVCDDVLVALNGKYTIAGMYTADIVIPHEPFKLSQLVFMFEVQTPTEHPFKSFVLQISLPGEPAPHQLDLSGAIQLQIPGRTRAIYRIPFLIQTPLLRTGEIEAKVIHEEGELLAGKHWVVTVDQAQALRPQKSK
jgi:hypothetical protein